LSFMKMHKIRRAEITWLDSGLSRYNGWEPIGDVLESKCQENVSVGWLLHETDEHYYLTLSLDPNNHNVSNSQVIYKPNVSKIRYLKYQEVRR
jgi:hypothetical protein